MSTTRTSKTAASKSDGNGAARKAQSTRSAAVVPAKTAAAKPVAAAPAVKARRSPVAKRPVKPVDVVSARAVASAVKPDDAPKAPKLRKAKLVREKFTMQEQEYQILSDLKLAFKTNGTAVKRSELVRVAVSLLTRHDLPALQALVAGLPACKPGSEKKAKSE